MKPLLPLTRSSAAKEYLILLEGVKKEMNATNIIEIGKMEGKEKIEDLGDVVSVIDGRPRYWINFGRTERAPQYI